MTLGQTVPDRRTNLISKIDALDLNWSRKNETFLVIFKHYAILGGHQEDEKEILLLGRGHESS